MPTLVDFRRRIRSVRNTQQITRAMKFVAAAKLRRAQERILAARPYARQIMHVLRSAMARVETPTHPLMARRAEEHILVVVVTGDKGLCGAFNANVIRKALEFVGEQAGRKLDVVPVGKKGRDAIRKRKFNLVAEYLNVSAKVEFAQAKQVADKLIEFYSTGQVDAIYAIYNEFKSVLAQQLIVEKLLPIEPELFEAGEQEKVSGTAAERGAQLPVRAGGEGSAMLVDYIYEQAPGEILDKLMLRHVETQVYRVLLESAAAEHAARMTAMDSATNNAAELIEQLTLHMNKVRQAAITKEIIEVVSGAASTA